MLYHLLGRMPQEPESLVVRAVEDCWEWTLHGECPRRGWRRTHGDLFEHGWGLHDGLSKLRPDSGRLHRVSSGFGDVREHESCRPGL